MMGLEDFVVWCGVKVSEEESRQGFVQVVVSLAPDQMMRLRNTKFL